MMDMFQIESSNISSTISDGVDRPDDITDVKFEAHSEFDLNFFETPDDSMTQCSAFSNPNSVESVAPSPEPVAPTTVLVSSSTPSNGKTASVVNVKIGKEPKDIFSFFSVVNSVCRLINAGFGFNRIKFQGILTAMVTMKLSQKMLILCIMIMISL